jgi:hypothetical protein
MLKPPEKQARTDRAIENITMVSTSNLHNLYYDCSNGDIT